MLENDLTKLLILAQKGDNAAYAQFLTEASKFIRKPVGKWLSKAEIQEEIVQEVLIAIHKNIHTFRPDLSAGPWIKTLAKYKVIDYLRKNRHQFQELTEYVTNNESLSYLLTDKEDVWDDLRDIFLLELERLDHTSREAIFKTKIEGKSTSLAARELGIRENAMRTRISRGIQRLKNSVLGIDE